jgi:hypothetical protein
MTKRAIIWGSSLVAGLVAAVAINCTSAGAYGGGTPDGLPPPAESVCDGLTGRVWGLCVAYCEAQDCFEDPGSEHPACDVLRAKLSDLTGSETFPCDNGSGGPG